MAFSRFAKSCGLAPAWRRLYELGESIGDLKRGRVTPLLTPDNTGKGVAPDSAITWNDRVLVLVAFAMLQKGKMNQQESRAIHCEKIPKARWLDDARQSTFSYHPAMAARFI